MNRTREFHIAMGIPAYDRPFMPDIKRVMLRQRLIREEFKEVMEEFERIQARINSGEYATAAAVYNDIARLGKELADLRYVCWGADLEFGIPSEASDEEVHRSNMSKLWEDGKPRHRHDGKVLKPPTYSEADMLTAIGILEGSISP